MTESNSGAEEPQPSSKKSSGAGDLERAKCADAGTLEGAPIEAIARESETQERVGADHRARLIRSGSPEAPSSPKGRFDPQLINSAVAALCEAVRDYAIFIMNPEGVIVYWGMGAQILKWWLREEAEGAHLRLLYPENGSEDGTAEAHLMEAVAKGEYVGEGQRLRRGGSTFWAHVSLTALHNPQGELLGFAKVTQDLTMRRATEAAVALANQAQTTREAAMKIAEAAEEARRRAEEARLWSEDARERAEQAAHFAREQTLNAQKHIAEVLQPALDAERAERASLKTEVDAYIQLFTQRQREEGERR